MDLVCMVSKRASRRCAAPARCLRGGALRGFSCVFDAGRVVSVRGGRSAPLCTVLPCLLRSPFDENVCRQSSQRYTLAAVRGVYDVRNGLLWRCGTHAAGWSALEWVAQRRRLLTCALFWSVSCALLSKRTFLGSRCSGKGWRLSERRRNIRVSDTAWCRDAALTRLGGPQRRGPRCNPVLQLSGVLIAPFVRREGLLAVGAAVHVGG
jgi:hypothetical protein